MMELQEESLYPMALHQIMLYLSCRATANQVRANISGSYDKTITISDVLLYGKLLIKYKSGDISFWVNGFEVDASTSSISY